MTNKNTNTNNNIIQILCEQKRIKRRKKKTNNSQGAPSSYMKYNEMDTKPFNLVNSFPGSSRLEDQSGRVRFMGGGIRNPYSIPQLAGQSERVRFMDAMTDPLSTKSPYSIFDNGSNTFPIQGNTDGAEAPVYPQLSQDDYFEQPPTRFSAQSSSRIFTRPLGRFSLNVDDFSDTMSDASPGYQELSTDQSRFIPLSDISEQPQEEDIFGISGTRFSERAEPPPAFSTPYRPQPEGIEEKLSESISRMEKLLDKRKRKQQKAINDMDNELEQIERLDMGKEDDDMRFLNPEEKRKQDSEAFISEIDRKELQLQELREKRQELKDRRFTGNNPTIPPPFLPPTTGEAQIDEVIIDVPEIVQPITRFASSNNPTIPPPFFQAPYRAEIVDEAIIETPKEEDIEQPPPEEEDIEQPPPEEDIEQPDEKAIEEELRIKKQIREKFIKIILKLRAYDMNLETKRIYENSPTVEETYTTRRGETKTRQVPFKTIMMELLRDENFKKYTGGSNNVGKMIKTEAFLTYFKKIAYKITEDIDRIEEEKKEKRQAKKQNKATTGNAQQFVKAAGGGVISDKSV